MLTTVVITAPMGTQSISRGPAEATSESLSMKTEIITKSTHTVPRTMMTFSTSFHKTLKRTSSMRSNIMRMKTWTLMGNHYLPRMKSRTLSTQFHPTALKRLLTMAMRAQPWVRRSRSKEMRARPPQLSIKTAPKTALLSVNARKSSVKRLKWAAQFASLCYVLVSRWRPSPVATSSTRAASIAGSSRSFNAPTARRRCVCDHTFTIWQSLTKH